VLADFDHARAKLPRQNAVDPMARPVKYSCRGPVNIFLINDQAGKPATNSAAWISLRIPIAALALAWLCSPRYQQSAAAA
jgi:hypothetical protein